MSKTACKAATPQDVQALLAQLCAAAAVDFEQARAMPPGIYTSPALLPLEIDRLFLREWICIGRSAEMPNPGDYLTFEIVDQPVFAIRQKDGGIKAFVNSCLHRCAKLLDGKGTAARIVCPYHAWTYHPDGRLVGAPHMGQARGFSTAGHRLVEVRCEAWEGFIYVTFNPEIGPVATRLAGMRELIGRYRLADYVPVGSGEESWHTNWKCFVENFMDAYHIFKVHKDSFGKYGSFQDATKLYRGDEHFTYHVVDSGPDANTFSVAHPDNTWLDGVYRRTTVLACAFPSHVMQIQPDLLWYVSAQPAGVDRTRLRWGASIPKEILASRPDVDAHIKEINALLTQVNAEDQTTIERVYQGALAQAARTGRLSHLELNVFLFGKYLAARLAGAAET